MMNGVEKPKEVQKSERLLPNSKSDPRKVKVELPKPQGLSLKSKDQKEDTSQRVSLLG